MRPGEFIWIDDGEDVTPSLVVSIALQRIYVYRGDSLVAVSTVSTGRPGHSTPRGTFNTLQKARWHRSNIYSNAPMPFMQRLTWDGIALHAGQNPGYPASHGCIRLPLAFARALFDIVPIGSSVTVADYPLSAPIVLEVTDFGLGNPEPRLRYAASVF